MKTTNYIPYQEYCPIDCTVEHRRKYYVGDVFENKAKCLSCGDVIMSKHVHDFVWCSCGKLGVDGGSHYAKRNFQNKDEWEEMSVAYENV